VCIAAVTVALLLRHRGRELQFVYALVAPLWGHRILLTTLLRISRRRGAMASQVTLRLWPLASYPVVILNDMDRIRTVMRDGDAYQTMGGENPVILSLLGDSGLFTTQSTSSPEWRRRRLATDRLLSSAPAFTDTMFDALLATSRAYVAAWAEDFPVGARRGLLLHEIARVVIPAQSIALFGPLFEPTVNRRAGEDLLANFQRVGEGLFFKPTAWIRRRTTRHHLGRSWAYIAAIAQAIRDDADGCSGRRDAAAHNGDGRPEFFRILRDAYASGTLDAREIKDTVALFLNAGAPIHLLFWTLLTLAQHPELRARVAEELRDAIAGGPLTFRRMGELQHLHRVVVEVMRLYPPVPLFQPRRATRDGSLGDMPVRAGTQILISPYVAHRNPAFSEDVETFRPERAGNGLLSAHMMPFSVGERTCQGRTFAMQVVKAGLLAVIERFDVHLDMEGPRPTASEAIYCRPSRDLGFSVTARALSPSPSSAAG
jgi:cytochrome P450